MLAKYIETETSIDSQDLEVNNFSPFSKIKTKFCRESLSARCQTSFIK